MKNRAFTGMILTLLLIGISTFASNIPPVKASGTIYIRPDGTVEGTDKIQQDRDVYTFTDNIYDEIVVEIDNIVVDGSGYTLQGPGSGKGIYLSGRSNVTVTGVQIDAFDNGIVLYNSSCNLICENNLTLDYETWEAGVYLENSSDNEIFGNKIGLTFKYGIFLKYSMHNHIFANSITGTGPGALTYGVTLVRSSDYNQICGNEVTAHLYGMSLSWVSDNTLFGNDFSSNGFAIGINEASSNHIYHNNFIDNTQTPLSYKSVNVWDDGYPSGGNYWSDYEDRYPDAKELDGSGIWDTPYEINADNRDNYPLMNPWSPPPPIPTTIDELQIKIEELGSSGDVDNKGIVRSLLAKLNVAQKLVDKGKTDDAKTILSDDFIPQVQELTSMHITEEAADILIKSAEYILSHL